MLAERDAVEWQQALEDVSGPDRLAPYLGELIRHRHPTGLRGPLGRRPAVGARGALFVVGQYGAAVLVFARAS
ncbi:hypothetical protein [Streptomyces sp. NBC_00280]|uniref:hypothetical protein n=1 Tax=Streptomyces sp. NBC_00280 TaxID=2975699 RepID=UPI003244ADFB